MDRTIAEFEELHSSPTFQSYILEPFGRNTAAAITAAAIEAISQHGHEAVLLVLAADHMITNSKAFQTAVNKAVELAQQGKLVTFGVKPKIESRRRALF